MNTVLAPLKSRWNALRNASSDEQLIAVHNGYCLWLALVTFKKVTFKKATFKKVTFEKADNESTKNSDSEKTDSELNTEYPVIEYCAQSNDTDPANALKEAKERLAESAGKKLPKSVVFISSFAVPALLDLPLDPEKPRKPAQMESMLGYELETLIADTNEYFTIGAILHGRHLITEQQRTNIAHELELRRSQGNSLARFGEVAIDLGFISKEDLHESLNYQERLAHSKTHIACGWQLHSYEREDETYHQWLTAGIEAKIRKTWYNGFVHNGFKVSNIVPLATCASNVAHTHGIDKFAVVETSMDYIAAYLCINNKITNLQIQARPANSNLDQQLESIITEITREECDIVWYTSYQDPSAKTAFLATLANKVQRDIKVLNSVHSDILTSETGASDTGTSVISTTKTATSKTDTSKSGSSHLDIPHAIHCAILGLAIKNHKFGIFGLENEHISLPLIPPKEPAPPVWKNVDVYRLGIPAALFFALIIHGVYSVWLQDNLKQELAALDEEYRQKLALNRQLSSINGEFKKKEQELETLEKEFKSQSEQLDRLSNRVMSRTRLVPRLLKTVALSVSNNVMIDKLQEPRRNSRDRFNLTAWATDNPSATEFIERLQQAVARLNYRVVDPDIQSGIGRFGLNGYTINLWLVPNVSTAKTDKSVASTHSAININERSPQ